jgi:hypothetical protein
MRAWWPDTDEQVEMERRARAALAEVGLDVHVTFVASGFHWPPGLAAIEPQIEKERRVMGRHLPLYLYALGSLCFLAGTLVTLWRDRA